MLAVAIAACSSDVAVAPRRGGAPKSGGSGPAVPPVVVALDITPQSGSTVALGSSFTLSVVAVRSDGARLAAANPEWSSLDPTIVTVNSVTGSASAVGVGSTSVTVRAGGVAAVAIMTVLPPPSAGSSTALTISAFSVVEYDYPSRTGYWLYAPQVTVTASAAMPVTVLDLQFSMPGFDPIPSFSCGGYVPAGASRDLNGEVYGDWSFSIEHGGSQPNGDDAALVLTFIDSNGATGTITTQGKIVRGALPTTYGSDTGACFHGIP